MLGAGRQVTQTLWVSGGSDRQSARVRAWGEPLPKCTGWNWIHTDTRLRADQDKQTPPDSVSATHIHRLTYTCTHHNCVLINARGRRKVITFVCISGSDYWSDSKVKSLGPRLLLPCLPTTSLRLHPFLSCLLFCLGSKAHECEHRFTLDLLQTLVLRFPNWFLKWW